MENNRTTEQLERSLRWYESKYGPYIEKRGLHNVGNLFRKPNTYEWTILFMLFMAFFIAWAYEKDTALCREYVATNQAYWNNLTNGTGQLIISQQPNYGIPTLNISNLSFGGG